MATKQSSDARAKSELEIEDVVFDGEYHFLDVGDEKYGECVLVVFGDVRILIDGSHQGDFRGRNGHASIPAQLAQILGEQAPHRISLLVVTHGHADHIGCLPDLVENSVVQAEWAFVTDPKLGFGRAADDAVAHDSMGDPRHRLAAALREEDASDLDDDALREFIDSVATVESRYAEFVENLKEQGTEVVFYQGQSLPAELAKLLKPTGATLLGPSEPQLLFCAEQIGKTNKGAEDAADEFLRGDATMDDLTMYRAAVARDNLRTDAIRNPRGSGMNCQSITFAFGPKKARVLLAGDMQFAEPGVQGADGEVEQLRQRVVSAGPYKVFKTTHHTSHNGQDDDWLTDLGNPPIIVHSGGLRDPAHPFPSVLKVLQNRRSQIQFARTDRNGHITVRPHLDGADAIEKSRGRLNDFSDNVQDTEFEAGALTPRVTAVTTVAATAPNAQVIIVNLPAGAVDMTIGGVDIVVRGRGAALPSAVQDPLGTRRRVQPLPRVAPTMPSVSLGAGRDLPNLLFVVNAERLSANIGRAEAGAALDAIRTARKPICEVGGSAPQAVSTVRAALERTPSIEGVVVLGGYDVVPCNVVDVLGPSLRGALGPTMVEVDDDHFIVWSDEAYGDIDGDRVAERPVSRIPDARNAALFLSALGGLGLGASVNQRFGVRNVARPFADDVWIRLAGNQELNVSKEFLTTDVAPGATSSAQLHYFMLHGDWRDGRGFYGEDGLNGYTNAFSVGNVPKRFGGVVLTGCCWGALTVSQKARDAGAAPLAPRVSERSIALSYLQAGAIAFVGCTGSHYSGADTDPDVNYAAHLHRAFWAALPDGRCSPAVALHKARQEYSALIAARADDMEPIDLARRMKNRAQFTCLGLGW